MSQVIIRQIANGAAKGNPTCLRRWLQMEKEALQERFDTYRSVQLIELLLKIVEDPSKIPDKLDVETLNYMLRKTKRLY